MSQEMSRRKFIEITGATAAWAAIASTGLYAGWGKNKADIYADAIPVKEYYSDVLVIGSGMAGLFAAVKAHDAGAKVTMVSKGRLGSSGMTPFAKGIFAFDPKTSKYSIDEFVAEVTRSAEGSNNPVYTRQLAEHSLARVKELRQWGFFDSPLYHKSFSRPINQRKIPVIERVTITHLVKDNGKITGAAGFSIDQKQVYFFHAKSIVLCTGAGGFKPNGFPMNDLTHDGTVMAYKIGAKVTGKEWVDGHVAHALHPADSFNGWHDMFLQKPNTTSVEIHHDLGVELNYREYKLGNPISMMGPGQQKEEKKLTGGPYVPKGFNHPEPHKVPPSGGMHHPDGPRPKGAPPGMGGNVVGGATAGLAIHKSEGIAPVNDRCASNIPGLFAAGDALGSHMSGGIYTQIGSSLAGSAVQGAIAGEEAAKFAKHRAINPISNEKKKSIQKEIFAPLNRKEGYSPAWVTQTLQGIMIPNFILYIKKEKLMQAALAYVEELRDHHLPMLKAGDLHELRLAHETANMIISAEMKLRASLMRTESRGSHFRLDYPAADNENWWQTWINIFQGDDGSMQLEKQRFSEWH
jgi:succinate dehydrogenase/fumarate reductase flavoprotein subunit